jgi:hypothetical protein
MLIGGKQVGKLKSVLEKLKKSACGRLAKDSIIRVIEAPLFLLPAAGGKFWGNVYVTT